LRYGVAPARAPCGAERRSAQLPFYPTHRLREPRFDGLFDHRLGDITPEIAPCKSSATAAKWGGKGFPHRKVFRRQNKRYMTVSAWLDLAQVMYRCMQQPTRGLQFRGTMDMVELYFTLTGNYEIGH
jgi:hypothetical protein